MRQESSTARIEMIYNSHMQKETIIFSKVNLRKFTGSQKIKFLKDVDKLIQNSWGKIDYKFIYDHVLLSPIVVIAKTKNDFIGLCAVSKKNICGKDIYYIELNVVNKNFQNKNIGTRLTFFALRNIIFANLYKIILEPINIMFLTPNVRVLAMTARFADFMYPNPYNANPKSGKIVPADEDTWELALGLIKMSHNPHRMLDREGLVLHGSFYTLPWLLQNSSDDIPWHKEDILNRFAVRYVDYGIKRDKEWVVWARFGLKSIYKYLKSL